MFLRTICLIAVAGLTPLAAQQVFFGNLHSHTSYSDGSGKPAEAYKFAKDTAKIDFLAISEHNHDQAESGAASDRRDGILIAKTPALYTGPQAAALIPAAKRATLPGKFVGLYGQEFSAISKGNHVNVFDVDAVIDVENGDFKGLVTWMEQHHDTAGKMPILQLNHPELFSNKATEYGADDFPTPAEWLSKIGGAAKLLEILAGPAMANSPAGLPRDAESEFFRFLNLGFRVGPTADQDNHYRTWGNASPARTGVVADTLSKESILEALRARHVYASEDSNLRVIFKVEDHLMGDVIAPPAAGHEFNITVSIHDDDEPNARYEIDVLSDPVVGGEVLRVIDTVTVEGNTSAPVHIEDVQFVGRGQYLLFRVRQLDEDGPPDRVWTAPVWFDVVETNANVSGLPTPGAFALASKLSSVYHVSADCVDAKRIKDVNRVNGADARQGRRPHENCPRRTQ